MGISEPRSVYEYISISVNYYKPEGERKWDEWDPHLLLNSSYPPKFNKAERPPKLNYDYASCNGAHPHPESPALNLPLPSLSLRRQHPSNDLLATEQAIADTARLPASHEMRIPDDTVKDNRLRNYVASRLGYRCLYDCNQVAIILPGVLVATVLVTETIRGIAQFELRQQVEQLREEVEARGGTVAQPKRSWSEAIEDVVAKVLGMQARNHQLVKRHKNFLMLSLWTPPEQLELSMMRNQLIHLFVMEGYAAGACCAHPVSTLHQ